MCRKYSNIPLESTPVGGGERHWSERRWRSSWVSMSSEKDQAFQLKETKTVCHFLLLRFLFLFL
jgi:hypothetical protein